MSNCFSEDEEMCGWETSLQNILDKKQMDLKRAKKMQQEVAAPEITVTITPNRRNKNKANHNKMVRCSKQGEVMNKLRNIFHDFKAYHENPAEEPIAWNFVKL